jgi:CRISPR-associated endonuclease/helicase Cas3
MSLTLENQNYYAHSLADGPKEEWEPLFTSFGEGDNECQGKDCEQCKQLEPLHGHMNKVAFMAGGFAANMFPEGKDRDSAFQWGYLTGLWHDLGKFAPEWQGYLEVKSDPHIAEATGTTTKKEDHSTAGAIFTHQSPPFGDLASYLIAGHHAGLANASYLFENRLKKEINQWHSHAQAACVPLTEVLPPPPIRRSDAGNDAVAFMLRYFFSALVDADYLATESFMSPNNRLLRQPWPDDILPQMLTALENYCAEKFKSSPLDPVNQSRTRVRQDCVCAAEGSSGFFALTVPTGGGKTLSSLLFALRHAIKNNQRSIIFVIPFTSIIKQNADVFREVFAPLSKRLGRDIVLEHHSKFEPTKETTENRLAAENWDSPLIVTTNVQFFESLYANRTSRCRKLHRTARSVIIFDEVQALPNALLHPIIRALRCLVHDLNASVVLCTATQPALERRDGFKIGIPAEEITSIIKDEPELFRTLERVTSRSLGPLDDQALIEHILNNSLNGCLLILNTTKAAQTLHEKLSPYTHALHLSARMCPRHVMLVLARAKRLRKQGKAVVLISTQLIEAGVDISFPSVYRAECGLDSFAQAAGRCNRNGELKDTEGKPIKGQVYHFQPTDHPIPDGLADIKANAGITRSHILANYAETDLLTPLAIRSYFEQAIWQAGDKTDNWDEAHIVSGEACFNPKEATENWAKTYQFKTAAERFRLINSSTHSILIPWGKKGEELTQEIRNLKLQNLVPNRTHYRRAQQFTVQVYENEWQSIQSQISLHCDEAFAILDHHQNDYHQDTGLKRPNTPADPKAYCL